MARDFALESEGLSVRFGGVTALDRVSVSVANQELRCLIGPNGAGKSTFFKCVTGQLRPTEGSVRIGGEETTGWNPHEIARLGVGIKTQVPSVMNGLTARENIWLAAKRKVTSKAADRVVGEVLERLGLGPIATLEVAKLAHGQRQLVELGIVLAGKPWLILLDEPAAGLTGDEVHRMAEVVREMNRDASLIIVEHDMHFIRSIAKIVTVFHQGRVLLEAPVDQVLSDARVRDVYLGKKR
jgi:branched-chain amino acid transport system ATP-binding protein